MKIPPEDSEFCFFSVYSRGSISGIDRGSWFVFRAFKQVPKSTLISALKKKLHREYNHLGWSICAALRLAITGFFDL